MGAVETSNLHKDNELRTHYYRDDYLICKLEIEKITKNEGSTLFRADDVFQEILVETANFTIIFSIVSITPIKTSIDINVVSNALLKSPKKFVIKLYEQLDKSLEYIGKGER